jgi:2-polyprenyl-3-methyl-5-hydroxy-6-metoxy-1,4-benzoquinol methylase
MPGRCSIADRNMAEQKSSYYDAHFAKSESYHRPYSDSHYFPLWVQLEFGLRPHKEKRILEIGCGSGQLARFLEEQGYAHYQGIDFSPTAIDIARTMCNLPVRVADAFSPEVLQSDYEVIVCTEVLEHIQRDRELVQLIRLGTFCFLSVPNFGDPSHVRFFRSEYAVRSRYFRSIKILKVHFINNIYLIKGVRSDFKPGLLQWLLKTREDVSLNSIWRRVKHHLR